MDDYSDVDLDIRTNFLEAVEISLFVNRLKEFNTDKLEIYLKRIAEICYQEGYTDGYYDDPEDYRKDI